MKYVITGASTYGVKNMGDDAMLANLVQGINREDPYANITFLARHPEKSYDKEFGFNSLKNIDHDSKEESIGRFFHGFNKNDNTNHLVKIKQAIEDSDLLIIGGNSFMEIAKNSFLRGVSSYAVTLATLSKFVGTPFALYGLNIVDPIRNETTIQHAKFLCTNAIAVTVREPEVFEYLDQIGVSTENMHVLGDPAFGIEATHDLNKAKEILRESNITLKDKPVLTVGYRFEYWVNNEKLFEKQAKKLAKFLDNILKMHNYQILFIPNCTYTKGHNWQDDRLTHRLIRNHMQFKKNAYLVEQDLSVFETYSLFSLSDLHISNRRHSNVFAALNGKMFFSINVSMKTHMSALLKSLDTPELMINLNMDFSTLMRKFEDTIAKEEIIKAKLEKNVSLLRKQARKHVPVILKKIYR